MKMKHFKNAHGEKIAADQEGNNVAFICQACGHPVLGHPPLSHPVSKERFKKPKSAECEVCGRKYSLKWEGDAETLVITYEHETGNF